MDACPKTRTYGNHSWRGERLIGEWFWMYCRWCGRTVLHSFSGKVNRA